MRLRYLLAATAAAFALSAATAQAAPMAPNTDAAAGSGVVLVHQYCHSGYQTHQGYYPPHYHAGPYCEMVTGGYEPQPRWNRQRYKNYPQNDNCVTLGTPGFGFQLCD
ncbi:MAG: hypothetical protein ACRED5_10490 [Propylenella sp.]